MGDYQTYANLLKELVSSAVARPDLGEREPVATYAGRVVRRSDTPASVLSRFPQAELESGGQAMGLIPGAAIGAGIRKTAQGLARTPSTQISRIAPQGATPTVPYTKMWPAWINEKTGEIRHAMQPILTGWHDPNKPKDFATGFWKRGHVDPTTWNAFPENNIPSDIESLFLQRMGK